jgi:Flp pilus assembly protein protease CpaA
MLSTALLVMLVIVVAVTDATQRTIYNWTTYPGILAGLGLAVIGAAVGWASPESAERWQPLIGWLPLSDALAGFLICGGLMVICFVFFPVGGGDVKLLTMIGSLAGLEMGLKVLLWTLIFGGCVGLTVLIWRIGAVTLVKRTGQLLVGVLTLGTVLSPPPEEQEKLKSPIFLGPCAAAALCVSPWFR